MDGDEVGSDDVPVHVLECQVQVVECAEPLLQRGDDGLAVHPAQTGSGAVVFTVVVFMIYECHVRGIPGGRET